jgi:hypothetical protein
MADVIRVEDLAKTAEEEKELIIKALHDKEFRDSMQQHVSDDEEIELSDEEADAVVGGAMGLMSRFNRSQLSATLKTVNFIQDRIRMGDQVLCGD